MTLTSIDRTLPCRTPSAARRHLARTEHCTLCGVVGVVPEHVWRRQPATPTVRAPEATPWRQCPDRRPHTRHTWLYGFTARRWCKGVES